MVSKGVIKSVGKDKGYSLKTAQPLSQRETGQ